LTESVFFGADVDTIDETAGGGAGVGAGLTATGVPCWTAEARAGSRDGTGDVAGVVEGWAHAAAMAAAAIVRIEYLATTGLRKNDLDGASPIYERAPQRTEI
jgi:hypothetical protein